MAEAASGAFDRVDVMIEIVGTENPGLTISLGGQPSTKRRPPRRPVPITCVICRPGVRCWKSRLAADDAMTLDDRARITLPDRQRRGGGGG